MLVRQTQESTKDSEKEIIHLIATELLEIKNLACFKISVVFIENNNSSIQGINPINLFSFKTWLGLAHHANTSKDFCKTTAKKSAILKKIVNAFHIQINLL